MLRRALLSLIVLITFPAGGLGSAAHLSVRGGVLQVFEIPAQIDLPDPPPPPSCVAECLEIEYLGASGTPDNTTLEFRITNNCDQGVNHVVLGTGAWTRITPVDKSVYTSPQGRKYDVKWTGTGGAARVRRHPVLAKGGAVMPWARMISSS
ncbi:MAG: hypothetical protein ACOX9A_13350 [Anaerolineae bacterium]|jgi:hypothetical protein